MTYKDTTAAANDNNRSTETQPFWMIIRRDGCGSHSTSNRHYSVTSAIDEAYRLSRKTGATFVVLKSTLQVQPANTPIILSKI